MIYISITIALLFIAHLVFLIWVLKIVESIKYTSKRIEELEKKFSESENITVDYQTLNKDL